MRRSPLLLLLLAACATGPDDSNAWAVRAVMAEQEEAWNRGSISDFMVGYSDTVCFLGRNGITCGREAVTANYVRSYPDSAAMGKLSFGIGEVLAAGSQHAWVTGTWRLHRPTDTLSGGFSLLWTKEAGVWRIVRDHTY